MSIQKITKTTAKGKVTRYRVFLPPLNGKRQSKQFHTRKEAVAWKAEQLAARGKMSSSSLLIDEDATVGDLFERWMLECIEPRREATTSSRYRRMFRLRVEPHIGHIPAHSLHPTEVAEWFALLAGQVADEEVRFSAASANMVLTRLKSLYLWATRQHIVAFDPTTAILPLEEGEKDFDFWSHEEVQDFLGKAQGEPNYLFYLTALHTGMRLGELIGLQRDCVDFKRNLIVVRRSWCNEEMRLKEKTKNKRIRSVPIPQTLRARLSQHLMELPAECPWVFPDPHHTHMDGRVFTHNVFRPLCRKLGVRELRFHDLRHTFASHFVMNGGDIYRLQKLLGHSTITTTERYAHLSPDHLQDAADVVSFRVPGRELQLVKGEKK